VTTVIGKLFADYGAYEIIFLDICPQIMESYFVSNYERMQKSNWKIAISLETCQLWPRKKGFSKKEE
jgi:hypothetical protein